MEFDLNESHLTPALLAICVIMNILGQGAHLLFVTIPDARQKMISLNKKFSFAEWWSCDWNLIIGVQVISLALLLGLTEFLHWKPGVLEYIRWFFFIFGTVGSLIGMRWSKYQKTIMGFIDVNANISSVVAGETKTVKELTEKASAVLNTDVSVAPKPEDPKS